MGKVQKNNGYPHIIVCLIPPPGTQPNELRLILSRMSCAPRLLRACLCSAEECEKPTPVLQAIFCVVQIHC